MRLMMERVGSYLYLRLRQFRARFRLSMVDVCEMSRGLDLSNDYHDYTDSTHGYPLHFTVMKCRRCGKEFTI